MMSFNLYVLSVRLNKLLKFRIRYYKCEKLRFVILEERVLTLDEGSPKWID